MYVGKTEEKDVALCDLWGKWVITAGNTTNMKVKINYQYATQYNSVIFIPSHLEKYYFIEYQRIVEQQAVEKAAGKRSKRRTLNNLLVK